MSSPCTNRHLRYDKECLVVALTHFALFICFHVKGTIHEDSGLDSSPSGGELLTYSRPLVERRPPPPYDQALKCPRCDSTHTKFCYYNNYSLSQPRYFCKTCRRYWTKGGTLRNIPVGGGCRKNKKVSSKKSNDHHHLINQNPGLSSSSHNSTDLHLSFPDIQFSHLGNILGAHGALANPNFMDAKYNAMLENQTPIGLMESKLEAIVGGSRNYDFMAPNVHGVCSPFEMSLAGNGGTFIDTCQRLMFPYEANEDHQNAIDFKPTTKLLSPDWQGQEGFLGNLGSWTGMMNGYGSSTTNSLV